MKSKKTIKILKPIIIVMLLVAALFFGFFLWVETSPGYSDYTIPEQRDAEGNIILVEDVPYYGYAEKVFWEGDYEKVREFSDKCYISKENEDYIIYDYKEGLAISCYCGDGGDVVIPETLDGKKVIKLGCYQDNYFEDEIWAQAAFFERSNTRKIKSLHIPSGVKEIVCYTFSVSGDAFEKITVDKDNPYYYTFAGMLFSKETNKLLCIPRLGYSLGIYAEVVSVDGGIYSADGKR